MRAKSKTLTRRNGSKSIITRRREGERTVAVIRGTGVHVWAIAGYAQLGMNERDIMDALPYLTLTQVRAALAYSQGHSKEIETILRENELTSQQAIERQERFSTLAAR
jgi:uncharacterized protein (DUF433 family)